MTLQEEKTTRVLIVDDDPISRLIMEEILKPEGYTIFTSSGGEQLLRLLEDCQPDVLLMDVLMPEINGFELCRRIKADPHWQHLPVVLVTSLNADEELVEGLDAGADEFISKPVGAAELRARVRSMRRVKGRADLLRGVAQMREDLANMVVHDMRTPLTVCLVRTDITLRTIERSAVRNGQGADAAFLKKSLGTIKEHLEELSAQVDEVLLMAKTEQDEIVLNREATDIGEVLSQVARDYQELASRQEVDLRLEIPAVPCERLLDRNLVRRMVSNLVGNALKFSPPNGTIALRLSAHEDGGSCLLEVTDEGPGVPTADRERIFDRYAVASAKRKSMVSIGLGLAFCRMVAEAHGGAIAVRDNRPRGAVFSVRI